MQPIYSIVVPVYNEELVIGECYSRLTGVMRDVGEPYELIFVNDGSRDNSLPMLIALCEKDPCVRAIDFSRNFGHQPAITAGMDYARGQAVVIIDADLQDPPRVIPLMIEKWRQGYEVVYGRRLKRQGETAFKKLTAKLFYRALRGLTDMDIPVDAGDFRLIDRKVCDALKTLGEKNRYVRGLVSWVGFKQTYVEYVRDERFAGETKYPLMKMLKFAMDGVTALTYRPLKFVAGAGALVSAASMIYFILFLCRGLCNFLVTKSAPSFSMLVGPNISMALLFFIQGVVLMSMGLMGEYIGRIYDEVKNRPNYIVSGVFGADGGDSRGRGQENIDCL